MKELSIKQKEAVNILGSNVLVFASAGAGKTTVLVSRLIKRIFDDGISLNNILAMTFTEAAAANMKYQLEKQLLERLNKTPDDEYLLEQLSLLDSAKICTIHSFCLSLIKEYYYLIGIKKSRINNVLNDADRNILLDKAFNKTLNEIDNIKELGNAVNTSIYNVDSLKTIVGIIFNKACANVDPINYLDALKQNKIQTFDDIDSSIKKTYLDDLKAYLLTIKKYAEIISKENETYINMVNNISNILSANDYAMMIDLIQNAFVNLPKVNEKNKDYREKIANILEKKIAPKLLNPKDIVSTYNDSTIIINELINFTKQYYYNYQSLKEQSNVLDFNDFEHFAYVLLTKDDNNLANTLKNKYQEIMIDEFQDTNDTQYTITSLISNNNLFIVGDTKQSIYRFRNAKPEIMNALKNDNNFKTIHLAANYRSNENIIKFNNELYTRIMNILSNDYPEEDIQDIGNDIQKDNNKKVQFIQNSTNDYSVYDVMANKIMELHERGKDFKDIAILVRTHDKKIYVKDALDKYNIPYFVQDKEGYLSSNSLDVLISYLNLLADNNDNISKVSVLSSPIYKLSDNDLIKLKDQQFLYQPLENDLNVLNALLMENNISQIIYYILNINNYYNDLPSQDKANIDLFIKDSLNRYDDLISLLSYIKAAKNYQSDSASTISENADVIKIMTIHTSKGLEFDTVFVLSENRNDNHDTRNMIQIDNKLGISMNYIYSKYKNSKPTINSLAIKAKADKEDILEYLRLCYVATTRAINELYIFDDYKERVLKDISEALLYERNGFSSYLFNLNSLETSAVTQLKDYKPISISSEKYIKLPSKNYSFEKIIKIKPSKHENNRIIYKENVEYGTNIHKLFEDLDITNPIINESEIINNYGKNALDAISSFINSKIINICKNYVVHKELEFTYRDDNLSMHGFMDFVAIGDKEIILIDYKTNANVTNDELISLYKNQIETYKKALSAKYHLPIKAYLYSTYLKEFVNI